METGKERSCQPCTACCDGWLTIKIEQHEVHPGRPCPYSTGAGCSNYENRPVDPCRKFHCGWRMQGSPLPDWMKPNESKVIVIPDNLPSGQPILMATPAGVSIPDRSLNWLKRFADQLNVPLLYTEQIMQDGLYTAEQGFRVHAPERLKEEVVNWMQSAKARA